MPDGREAQREVSQTIVNAHERAAASRPAGETGRYRSERASERARILRVQNLLLAAAHRRLREKKLI
jgi:hypothetical protein